VQTVGSVRRHLRIAAPPDEVWAVVGDAARLGEWFPVAACTTDLDATPPARTVTLATGMTLTEEIVTVDADLRRFQYRIVDNPVITEHLGTVDVLADGDGSLVIYSTDAKPDVFALTIGGGAGAALDKLKATLETTAHTIGEVAG
jgi:uncharacterized protein YndB with AHSA1/START domain